MKIITVLQKIKNDYNEETFNSETLDRLIEELGDACDRTVVKERISLINKFAKNYNLHPEEVEKQILPKKKRHIIEDRIRKFIEIQSKQMKLYKKFTLDNKIYYREDNNYGMVYNESMELKGYVKNGKIIFI